MAIVYTPQGKAKSPGVTSVITIIRLSDVTAFPAPKTYTPTTYKGGDKYRLEGSLTLVNDAKIWEIQCTPMTEIDTPSVGNAGDQARNGLYKFKYSMVDADLYGDLTDLERIPIVVQFSRFSEERGVVNPVDLNLIAGVKPYAEAYIQNVSSKLGTPGTADSGISFEIMVADHWFMMNPTPPPPTP